MKPIFGPWIFRAAIMTAFVLASLTAYGQEAQTVKDPVALVNGEEERE